MIDFFHLTFECSCSVKLKTLHPSLSSFLPPYLLFHFLLHPLHLSSVYNQLIHPPFLTLSIPHWSFSSPLIFLPIIRLCSPSLFHPSPCFLSFLSRSVRLRPSYSLVPVSGSADQAGAPIMYWTLSQWIHCARVCVCVSLTASQHNTQRQAYVSCRDKMVDSVSICVHVSWVKRGRRGGNRWTVSLLWGGQVWDSLIEQVKAWSVFYPHVCNLTNIKL